MKDSLMGVVDIGGTKIMVGVADTSGNVLTKQSFPTIVGEGGAERSVSMIASLLKEQCRQQNITLLSLYGIGVVCAGPVDVESGVVHNPYTLPGWDGFPFSARLSALTGLPVQMENDANGALIGEVVIHHLENKRVLMAVFGTGIGVAFMENGIIHRAGSGYHPEMGHIVVASHGEQCYCGQVGCFESLCSGTTINRRAVGAGYKDFDELFTYYKRGDAAAVELVEKIIKEFTTGLWNLCVVFRPEILILGGGIMEQYYDFFSACFPVKTKEWEDFIGTPKLLQAEKQSYAALVGAAQLQKQRNERLIV